MKLMKNWKRIIAGFMAFAMVFLSVDGGCISALASEIQEWDDEQEITESFPTGGLMQMKGMEVSLDELNRANDSVEHNVLLLNEEDGYDWEKFSTKYIYNQLSPEWKDIWDDMDELCLSYLNTNVDGVVSYNYFVEKDYYFTTSMVIEHEITSADFYTLYSLFLASNPQYYFLGQSGFEYVYANDDDFIDSVGLGIYQAFLDGDTRLSVTSSFQSAIEEAYAGLSESATDEEILRHLHDYVVCNVEYNHEVLKGDNTITDDEDAVYYTQSAYSGLCMDTTVCAGYAEALQLLCNGFGIDSLIVTSSDHMWNKVRINDCWYNVDPTWADNGMTDGVNNPIYYGYYGRSDEFYEEKDTNANASSHISESLWDNYLPECTKDTVPITVNEPGTFYVPTETLPAPIIKVTKNETDTYDVSISMDENHSDVIVYYTLDGIEPSVSSTKSYIYNEPFTVEPETVIRAIAVADGYYDSLVAEKKAVMTVENVSIQNHFYQKLVFAWDALGDDVDGYVINVFNGLDSSKVGETIEIISGETNYYQFVTKDLSSDISVYYEIYGYVLDDNQNKVVATETALSGKSAVNQLSQPLDVDVKWHVTTSEGANYLVVNVEEATQDKLCLWYYTDEDGVNFVNIFTLDMTDGVTEFKYSLDKHDVDYSEVGYVFITDASKGTAFQEEGFAVGGEYKAPVLEPIEDVYLQSSSDSVTLNAVIKAETEMENFNYKYQWYVAEDATAEGTAISGATSSAYTVQIGTFDVKYYYCKVTAEYLTKYEYVTTNGTQTESFVDKHTRVEGALYDTAITYEPIENQVFTGSPIVIDNLVILKNHLGEALVLGEDYTLAYENNVNVGEATITIEFVNDYAAMDDARINFTIEPKTVSENPAEFEFTDISEDKEYKYNGQAHEPSMIVTDVIRNYTLVKEVDYDIAYNANVDAGTATITLNFKNNYEGRVVFNFEILPKETTNVVISQIEDYVYTGKAIVPELNIRDNDNNYKLVLDKDYQITCVNNINVGGADVTVKFIGNYEGVDRNATFNIVKKDATNEDVLITKIVDQEYTGNEIKPVLKVVYGDNILTEGVDYTVIYENNVELGDATVTLTFGNNYKGTRVETFKIVARDAESLTYTELLEVTYTGEAFTPELEIKNGEVILLQGTDYDVEYSDNINASTAESLAKATVTFKGNYTGTKVLNFKINPKSAVGCEVTLEDLDDYTYSGNEFKPGVIVKDGEKALFEGEDGDFTVSYENNINAGTATVIVDFIGNYEGQTQKTFEIKRRPITEEHIVIEDIASQTYNGKAIVPEIVVKETVTEGATSNILRAGEDYTVDGYENVYVGTATLVVSLDLEGNYIYIGEDIEVTFEILPRDSANVEIEAIPEKEYTGSAIKPNLVVKDGDIVLVAGRDYNVEYANNENVGTATVTITFDNNFTGNPKYAYFTIVDPIPTAITSSVFSINQTTGYISKITVGTTVQTLLSSLNERDYVSIFDKNGTGLSGKTTLGTGMTACIMDEGAVTKRYTIVVTGDVNEDGVIDIADMVAVKAQVLGKGSLTGAKLKAGDVNVVPDGIIDIADFIRIKAHILKKDTIKGVSVK